MIIRQGMIQTMALSGSLAIMAFRKPFNVCFARLYLFLFSRARNFCQFMAYWSRERRWNLSKEEMENHAEIVTNSMELKLKFNGNPPKGKKYFKDQNFHFELDVKRLH